MSAPPSLTVRATLAIVLMVGFYILALFIAGLLLYFVYADITHFGLGFAQAKVAVFCFFGALIILAAILPRPDRFIPPGPALKQEKHPDLFKEVATIALATGQATPSEIYLIPDMNAYVTHRGGVMGFGSRQVMGLGLPLLQVLSVPQLRAILAHEFGHFHGGDTKLGPWIYKTRTAIVRTITALASHSELLQAPFIMYAKAFLRITHAVSRRQEFAADALAARLVGAQPMIEGLSLIHSTAPIFEPYFYNFVAPVLSKGLHPPLADGFRRYLAGPKISETVSANFCVAMIAEKENPYDTHPSLRHRLDALQKFASGQPEESGPAAISLLQNVKALEAELFQLLLQSQASLLPSHRTLAPVDWEEVGERVWAGNWETQLKAYGSTLTGLTVRKVAYLAQNPGVFAHLVRESGGKVPSQEEQHGRALTLLGIALSLALHRQGWTIRTLPGEEVLLQHVGTNIKPFETIQKLASGELAPDWWEEFCRHNAVADLDLRGTAAVAMPAASKP